jgi:hypothetical protein
MAVQTCCVGAYEYEKVQLPPERGIWLPVCPVGAAVLAIAAAQEDALRPTRCFPHLQPVY